MFTDRNVSFITDAHLHYSNIIMSQHLKFKYYESQTLNIYPSKCQQLLLPLTREQ